MSQADVTYGKCPICGCEEYMTGRWQTGNPTLSNGKRGCVECKVSDIYSEFWNRKKA